MENPIYRTTALRQLNQLIRRHRPDCIWANHFAPAQLSALQRRIPFVYSHHDWLYKIKAMRIGCSVNARLRAAEERVSMAAAAVVSGSVVECEHLRKLRCNNTHYIPVAYQPVPLKLNQSNSDSPRLVHLGGLSTTANQRGLERFFDVVWPALWPNQPNIELIGDVDSCPPGLLTHLAHAKCHGYVADLGSVLRPYDLFVIPWEHSTGQRTKLPLAFNFAQVVISTQAAVACFPEAVDGENCRLVEGLDEMADVIKELLHDLPQRERLGRAARQTFETSFTRQALLPQYQRVVASVCRESNSEGRSQSSVSLLNKT